MDKSMIQMKKLDLNNFAKAIPLVMVVAFAIIMTFINEIAPNYPKEYYTHKKKYTQIIIDRKEKLNELVKGSNIEDEFHDIMSSSSKELQEYTRIKNKMKKDISVLGYSSPKRMWFGIGFPIFGLIVSLLFYSFVYSSKEEMLRRKLYLRLTSALILTASYWTAWSLLWFKIDGKFDFPDIFLYLFFILVSIVNLSLFKYLIQLSQNKETKLLKIIKSITRFIIKDAKQHVKPSAMSDYKKGYLKALKDGMS